MKSKAIWAMVVLNVLLLASLCLRSLTPAAHAQAAARASDYIMIPGEVVGGSTSVIYIVDERNGLLSARTLDGKQLIDIGTPIDLNRYFAPTPRR